MDGSNGPGDHPHHGAREHQASTVPHMTPIQFGKYELLDRIGLGGMAEVFLAKSRGAQSFEKVWVIKRILPHLASRPHFVNMFVNEANIAVSLTHGNIVQVFDLGQVEGTYYIAMEHVQGHDLGRVTRVCRKRNIPIPVEMAVFVAIQVTNALEYAHRRRDAHMVPMNIVHRDVSPQNILISEEGEVKLTDFGIARARNTLPVNDHQTLQGKYPYMSPEQARGEEVDARTDIFSLGTVLYELLTGENPFACPSMEQTLDQVASGSAVPVHVAHPHVPEALSHILAVAMSPSAEGRHPTAGHLHDELLQFLQAQGENPTSQDLSVFLEGIRKTETP